MKKKILSLLMAVLALTLVLTLAACNDDHGEGSRIDPEVTTDAPDTTDAPETTVHTHSYTSSVTAPTCTAEGFTTYTCECGDSYTDTPVAATGHTFGEWKTTKAATCLATGVETRTCSVCGATENRDTAKAAHDYVKTVTAPTKTTQGYTTNVCYVCKDSYVDNYTNPTGSVGLTYSQNTDGTLTITGLGNCSDTDIIIYSTTTEGKTVSAIAPGAFMNATKIKTVYIPASITSIGDGAFAGCTALSAFTVEAENKNFSVKDSVLYSKDGTTIVAYPAGLTAKSFEIAKTITAVRPGAFAGAANLEELKVAKDSTVFAAEDGVLYNFAKTTLVAYPAGDISTTFPIPTTVDKIEAYAFFNAAKLADVTLPETVVDGSNNVTVKGVQSIGTYAFAGSALTAVELPNATSDVGAYAFANCAKLASIDFGSETRTIGKYCFSGCTALTKVVLPAALITVEEGAFYNCTNLATLVIPKSVRFIEARAFTGCLNLGKDATTGKKIGKVLFEGSSDTFYGTQMKIDATNMDYLALYADLYFYTESQPAKGNYWHYVDGVPTIW